MHLGLEGFAPLLIYVGSGIAFLLSIFWKPQIGFYFLIPLLPMQTIRYRIHSYPFGEKLVDVLLLGILIGLLFRAARPIFAATSLNRAILAFSALLYFSLWQGSFFLGRPLPLSIDDPRFSDWKNYIEMMFLFFIAAAVIRTPRQMKIAIGLMCLSVLLVNRSYHSTVSARNYSQFSYELREAGVLGYAGENGMGAFQAEFAVFLIGLASFARKVKERAVIWGIAFTSIYCLVFTFSRGAYLGFLFGLLVFGLVKERKFLIVLAVILVSWQSLVPNAVRDRVLMTYQEGQGLDSSAEERMTIWQDALQVIEHEPILGTGFNTYQFMGRVGPYQDTHNYYLKVVLELGFVGLLVFLWMLGVACKMSWILFRNAKDPFLGALGCAVFSMLLCGCVVNFFGDRWTYLQVNGFFWILIGFVARGLVLAKQEQELMEPGREELGFGSSATEVIHA